MDNPQELKKVDVEINGIPTTLKLTQEQIDQRKRLEAQHEDKSSDTDADASTKAKAATKNKQRSSSAEQ